MAIIRMPSAFREGKDPVEQSMKLSQIDLMQKQKGATAVNTALAAMKLGDAVMESKPINAMVREVGSWFGDEGSTKQGEKLFKDLGKKTPTTTTKAPTTTAPAQRADAIKTAAGLGQGTEAQGAGGFWGGLQAVSDAGKMLQRREEAKKAVVAGETQAALHRRAAERRGIAAEARIAEEAADAAEDARPIPGAPGARLGDLRRLVKQTFDTYGANAAGELPRVMRAYGLRQAEQQWAERALLKMTQAAAPADPMGIGPDRGLFTGGGVENVWQKSMAALEGVFGADVVNAVADATGPGSTAAEIATATAAAEAQKAFGATEVVIASPRSAQAAVQDFVAPQATDKTGQGTIVGTGKAALDRAAEIAGPQTPIKLLDSAEGRMARVMEYATQISKLRQNPFPSKERLKGMGVEALIAMGETHELSDDEQAIVEYLIDKRAVITGLDDMFGGKYKKDARARFAKNVAKAKKGRYRDPIAVAKDLVTMDYQLQRGRGAEALADKRTVEMKMANEFARAKTFNAWMHIFSDPDYLKVWGKKQFRVNGGTGGRASGLMGQIDYNKAINDTTKNAGPDGVSNHDIIASLSTGKKNDVAASKTIQANFRLLNDTNALTRLKNESRRRMNKLDLEIAALNSKGGPKTQEQREWLAEANRLKRAHSTMEKSYLNVEQSPHYEAEHLGRMKAEVARLNDAMAAHERGRKPPAAARATPDASKREDPQPSWKTNPATGKTWTADDALDPNSGLSQAQVQRLANALGWK